MTLTEFLLARIAEDEAVVRAASEAFTRGVSTPPRWTSKRQWERHDPAISEQIRRFGPARLLAECEAKRRIVQIVGTLGGHYEPNASRIAPEIVRQLALPYADHPDYRQEWRP